MLKDEHLLLVYGIWGQAQLFDNTVKAILKEHNLEISYPQSTGSKASSDASLEYED